MIIGRKVGDVIAGPERHIAFAVNSNGGNHAGLAGSIARNFWPELAKTGPQRMGAILSKESGRKFFHALVVHSLEANGWEQAPYYIETCFNELQIPTDDEVASVTMGAGIIGRALGANPEENLAAMERSNKSIIIYDFE